MAEDLIQNVVMLHEKLQINVVLMKGINDCEIENFVQISNFKSHDFHGFFCYI